MKKKEFDWRWPLVGAMAGIFIDLVILVIAALAIWDLYTSDQRTWVQRQEIVQDFNAREYEERVTIAEWEKEHTTISGWKSLPSLNEDYFMMEPSLPLSLGEIWISSLPFLGIAWILIISIMVFYGYNMGLREVHPFNYCYAEIPKDGWKTVAFFFAVFACWPILLVSFIRLKCRQRNG